MSEGGGNYFIYFENISVASIKSNLSYYLQLPSQFFAGAPQSMILYGTCLPLAFAGAWSRYRTDYPAIIYIVLTLLLYVIWPSHQGIRFIIPILPFFISFVISGLEIFVEGAKTKLERRFRQALSFIPVGLVLIFFIFRLVNTDDWNFNKTIEIKEGPFAQTSQEMFSYIENHTDQNSIIIFFKPRVMKLMTNRQSILIISAEQLMRANYLCVYLREDVRGQVPQDELEPLLLQGSLPMVYENDDFKLYRIVKTKESPSP